MADSFKRLLALRIRSLYQQLQAAEDPMAQMRISAMLDEARRMMRHYNVIQQGDEDGRVPAMVGR